MAKTEEKKKAFALRRYGLSIKEIGKKLGVSSSTISIWVRNLELTPQQTKRLNARMLAGGHRGRMIGAAINKEKKQEKLLLAREEAVNKINGLTDNELFFVGLGLFWGEGTKSEASALAISNTDPAVVQVAMRWFEVCFNVERGAFLPKIFINATHRKRENQLIQYWSKALGLPKEQFSKTVFLKRKNKKVYENHNTYYGVLALRIRKGAHLRYRILALIKRLSEPSILSG
jgi:hypothetical protein